MAFEDDGRRTGPHYRVIADMAAFDTRLSASSTSPRLMRYVPS